MRGEQDFERLQKRRGLPGALEDILDLLLMSIRHGGNDRLFVFEVTIDEPDTDAGFGADIVHARLMEASLGEANHRGLKDLSAAVRAGFQLILRHWAGKMNERSFIVKS